MTHIRLKLSVAALLLVSAVTYLTYAGVQKGWVYTVGVDQFAANVEQHALRVRLCGTVSPDHLDLQKARLTANFLIKGEHASLPVAYHGVIPDMFKPGCEVVVEGKLDDAGRFHADTLMTKCASKYEGMPKNHPPVTNAAAAGGQS
ncbi:MAG: cytochrome c maturation protein CcmE [Phycisphaerae bacterium]